jgi:hypothetical protein
MSHILKSNLNVGHALSDVTKEMQQPSKAEPVRIAHGRQVAEDDEEGAVLSRVLLEGQRDVSNAW